MDLTARIADLLANPSSYTTEELVSFVREQSVQLAGKDGMIFLDVL
jgi:hypothetical protein